MIRVIDMLLLLTNATASPIPYASHAVGRYRACGDEQPTGITYGIATNVLAARLAFLEEQGILSRAPSPDDGRKDFYTLTEKGLDLIPIVLNIVLWSANHDSKSHVRRRKEFVARLSQSPLQVSEELKALVRNGGCIFPGRARNEQDGNRALSRRTNDMRTPPATRCREQRSRCPKRSWKPPLMFHEPQRLLRVELNRSKSLCSVFLRRRQFRVE